MAFSGWNTNLTVWPTVCGAYWVFIVFDGWEDEAFQYCLGLYLGLKLHGVESVGALPWNSAALTSEKSKADTGRLATLTFVLLLLTGLDNWAHINYRQTHLIFIAHHWTWIRPCNLAAYYCKLQQALVGRPSLALKQHWHQLTLEFFTNLFRITSSTLPKFDMVAQAFPVFTQTVRGHVLLVMSFAARVSKKQDIDYLRSSKLKLC